MKNRIAALAAVAALWGASAPALAQEKFTFLTNWYAIAEHGGFYQALTQGLYKKVGLDVTIRMGGPQVNGMQLLAAGQADCYLGFDVQTMKVREQGVDAVPQTAGDGALAQTVAEDIFEKAVGGIGELLPAVDESVPVIV